MKIVVLVKQVPDTWGVRGLDPATHRVLRDAGDAVLDEICERALEVALRVTDADRGSEVVVITMGPAMATTALRTALAMGADRAVHVLDDSLEGADLRTTAAVLATTIEREAPDLVVTGNASTDGAAGVLAGMLAEHLGLPGLDGLDQVIVTADAVEGRRRGDRGTERVTAALPAVVSVTERAAEARFAGLRGIMAGKRKPIETVAAPALAARPSSRAIATSQRPAPVAGRVIVDDGQAAAELADFLVSRGLLERAR
jgi:electron transfer flavoprotein beta subunit